MGLRRRGDRDRLLPDPPVCGRWGLHGAPAGHDARRTHRIDVGTGRRRDPDIAITKLAVPTSASTGQTRQISVGIKNNHYPENVLVQLFKSYPVFGFALIDNLTQPVPVRPSNRTTSIDFNYTFTSDDAIIGKVTFKVVAYLLDARDASPADNEATASPTKINR